MLFWLFRAPPVLTGSGALAAESDDKVGNSKESRELQMAIPASENKEAQHPQSLRAALTLVRLE